MENFCRGICWGLVTGAVIGGVMVAKNKQLAGKIRKGLGIAEEKMQEAKEFIEEKIEESKNEFGCEQNGCGQGYNKSCNEKTGYDYSKTDLNKDLNKKTKN